MMVLWEGKRGWNENMEVKNGRHTLRVKSREPEGVEIGSREG